MKDPHITQLMSVVANSDSTNEERQAAYDKIEEASESSGVSLEDMGVTASWRTDALRGLRQDPSRDPDAPLAADEDPDGTAAGGGTETLSVVDAPSHDEIVDGADGKQTALADHEADKLNGASKVTDEKKPAAKK